MFKKYLLTGATGFLGRAVIKKLMQKGGKIQALVLKNDPLAKELPSNIEIVYGDICDDLSLERFFSDAGQNTCVIHCAGMISVASHPGDIIYQINVQGTLNILRHSIKAGVGKLVYVSSVHAFPEKSGGSEITEHDDLLPSLVSGHYAKSKAAATFHVFEAASRGLNASVVYPSGIIGPEDLGKGSITSMLLSFLKGKLPLAVKGGYDFVDVRDVAAGIVSCTEHGRPRQGYILSGHYATIRDILNVAKKSLHLHRKVVFLPIRVAKLIAPIYEKRSLRKRQPLYLTPYALSVLSFNCRFNRSAAEAELGYSPRPLENSIEDTVRWLMDKESVL